MCSWISQLLETESCFSKRPVWWHRHKPVNPKNPKAGRPSASVFADSPGTGGHWCGVCLLGVLEEDLCGPLSLSLDGVELLLR